MIREDFAEFFRLIDKYSPGFASKDRIRGLADVWEIQMRDVSVAMATAAVHVYYSTETRWIMPADVRRYAATVAGVLAPDPATARAQALKLRAWYGPAGMPLPDPSTRPDVHPAVQAAVDLVGIEQACTMSAFDWRGAYSPRAAEFERRTLTPGGIPAGQAALDARPPRRVLDAVPAVPETFGRAAELRERRAVTTARLDEVIAELGDDARFLLPPGTRLGSRFARAALVHRLAEYGFDRDEAEAMRRARLEIARHSGSGQAADLEARRAAALRALEAMGAADGRAS